MDGEGPKGLDTLRSAIDAIDDDILEMLSVRARISLAVGELKKELRQNESISNLAEKTLTGAVFHPHREKAILERLAAKNKGPLPQEHLAAIYREIMSSSRRLQGSQRVAYLGPEGTFSHLAAVSYLGRSADYLAKESLEEVFAAVVRREADLGVIPLENSIHGTVGQSLDLFFMHRVRILAEVYRQISHCLLGKNTDLKEVRQIFSHPQPLAQCANWLRLNFPNAQLIPTESTAVAASLAMDNPNCASVGPKSLAKAYGLRILAEHIEDIPDNWTRFLVISSQVAPAEGPRDKTSILFTVPDKPGALVRLLSVLAEKNINMIKLESRPIKSEKWKYMFFTDLECDLESEDLTEVRKSMEKVAHSLRILGAYPSGPFIYASSEDDLSL